MFEECGEREIILPQVRQHIIQKPSIECFAIARAQIRMGKQNKMECHHGIEHRKNDRPH